MSFFVSSPSRRPLSFPQCFPFNYACSESLHRWVQQSTQILLGHRRPQNWHVFRVFFSIEFFLTYFFRRKEISELENAMLRWTPMVMGAPKLAGKIRFKFYEVTIDSLVGAQRYVMVIQFMTFLFHFLCRSFVDIPLERTDEWRMSPCIVWMLYRHTAQGSGNLFHYYGNNMMDFLSFFSSALFLSISLTHSFVPLHFTNMPNNGCKMIQIPERLTSISYRSPALLERH